MEIPGRDYRLTRHVHEPTEALQSIDKVLDGAVGEARQFGEELKQICQEAIGLWHEREQVKTSLPQYMSRGRKLLYRIDEHLGARPLADPDAQRLLNELGRHDERGNLFRFLTDPRVPPTTRPANTPVEQMGACQLPVRVAPGSVGTWAPALRAGVHGGLGAEGEVNRSGRMTTKPVLSCAVQVSPPIPWPM